MVKSKLWPYKIQCYYEIDQKIPLKYDVFDRQNLIQMKALYSWALFISTFLNFFTKEMNINLFFNGSSKLGSFIALPTNNTPRLKFCFAKFFF